MTALVLVAAMVLRADGTALPERDAAVSLAPHVAALNDVLTDAPTADPKPVGETKRVIPGSFYVFGASALVLGGAAAFIRRDASLRADRVVNQPGQYDRAAAQAEIDTVRTENALMVGAIALGAACFGIAIWRLASAPVVETSAYVAPNGGGVSVRGAF